MNIKKLISIIGGFLLTFVFISNVSAVTTPNWDISGTWTLDFAGGNDNRQFVDLVQNCDGNVSGEYWWINNSSVWEKGGPVIGYVAGDNLHLDYDRYPIVYTGVFEATINASGMSSGTFVALTGSSFTGNWSAPGSPVALTDTDGDGTNDACDTDDDNDLILDEVDYCPNTSPVRETLTEALGVNRNIWDGTESSNWTTLLPKGKDKVEGLSSFNMTMTHGCSCIEILDLLKKEGLGEFGGHYKFGCSKSVMEDFVKDISDGVLDGKYYIETVTVLANKYLNSSSIYPLALGITYDLKAYGTWVNRNNVNQKADAEYATLDNWGTWEDGYDHLDYHLGLGEFDLQIDNAFVDWGSYNSSHIYNRTYLGTGSPVNFRIFDGYSDTSTLVPSWYSDNSEKLYVDIIGQI